MMIAPATAAPPDARSLGAIQAALRKTTETLAHELASPGSAVPQWSESEWLIARAVVSMHGVAALLSRSLRWQGVPGWMQFLSDQRAHIEVRFGRIRSLLQSLDDEARRSAVPLVALKGAALHALGIYVPGDRPMADVDLLARAEDTERAVKLLETLGFEETYATWKHRVFEPVAGRETTGFGENSANAMKIELHFHIGEQLPLRAVDVSQRIYARPDQPGLNTYPSRAALMAHLLLHAAGAMAFRALRLIHLNDLARLSAHMTVSDWDELLLTENPGSQAVWWAYPPLALTALYYESAIPERVLATTRACCPWLLRQAYRHFTLSDVSLSHLWINAFPGIEWVRSPREMFAYVAARLAPTAEIKALRTISADLHPAFTGAWNRMSQGRRIVRWVTSRPARPETLQTVSAALAQSH
jgi:Uncharacterised nucleotidyltransferase